MRSGVANDRAAKHLYALSIGGLGQRQFLNYLLLGGRTHAHRHEGRRAEVTKSMEERCLALAKAARLVKWRSYARPTDGPENRSARPISNGLEGLAAAHRQADLASQGKAAGGRRCGQVPPGPSAVSPLVFNDRVSSPKPSDVRQWARASGLVTADRGRLPRSVLEAYATAHAQAPGVAVTRRRRSGPRNAAHRGDTPTPAKKETGSRRKGAPASPPNVAATPEQRLQAVEAQLADALKRISALESRSVKSLFGLRTTL